MIGVIAEPAEHDVVREFFELFKTPWEFYRESSQYDAIVCTAEVPENVSAKLVIVYASRSTRLDRSLTLTTKPRRNDGWTLAYQGTKIPIYGEIATFDGQGITLALEEGSGGCAAYLQKSEEKILARIGYDLFGEIRRLLTAGQPPANAAIPALELHISLLRDLIVSCGFPLVEIPPVPEGYRFVVCLTHDVDHPSVRSHKVDRTTTGFLFRALFVSVVDTLLGRMAIRDVAKNWVAAFKLPFVHLGLAKDFWRDFDDRYLELEKGLPSTFFVIPRKNYAGKRADGLAPAARASGYEASEIADAIQKLRSAGREIGLHGIDAWLDASAGQDELAEIRRLSGESELGVRMHWLYFNENSPTVLEKAGAAYDSTVGYNQTVGFRAGTTQAYKPLEAEQLLELPLHAMDTSLFYLSYLGLSPKEAAARLRQTSECVVKFGGCFTINWHDRSLAPERLWVDSYRDLIQELKSQGAWFATASQATAWFRKRRSAMFEARSSDFDSVDVKASGDSSAQLPGLRLRVYQPKDPKEGRGGFGWGYSETMVEEEMESNAALDSRKRVPSQA